jgi:hypothetical protein
MTSDKMVAPIVVIGSDHHSTTETKQGPHLSQQLQTNSPYQLPVQDFQENGE